MTISIAEIQERLAKLGFAPGPADGIMGPRTEAAIVAFKRSVGLAARPYVGPITLEALFAPVPPPALVEDPLRATRLPWIKEALRLVGRHETADNDELRAWLRSDGATLGDPAQLPWCGDFVETAIRLALPGERVPKNPYWALNWREFGAPSSPTFGAVASIRRDGGGHVGFLVGQDATRLYLLGGNQANRVSVVPVDRSRFEIVSFRWPATYPDGPTVLPQMTSAQASNVSEA